MIILPGSPDFNTDTADGKRVAISEARNWIWNAGTLAWERQTAAASGASNQGTAAAASGAWPVYVTVSGSAIDPRSIRALTATDVVTTTPPTSLAAYGTASVVPSAQGTVFSVTTVTQVRLFGFAANGDGDGLFELQVGGTTVLSDKINGARPGCAPLLPAPQVVGTGILIALLVTCGALATVTFRGGPIYG